MGCSPLISEHRDKSEAELRTYLGNYGFAKDQALNLIKNLSGGEKARLTIASLILHKPNILLLDEPTNHLDLAMREELARSLQDFNGAVIVVSHDKFLLDSIVDDYYLILNHKLEKFNGNLEEYYNLIMKSETLLPLGSSNKPSLNSANVNTNSTNTSQLTPKNFSQIKSKMENIERKLEKMQEELSNYEDKLSVIAGNFANHEEFVTLNENYLSHKEKITALEASWLELSELIT